MISEVLIKGFKSLQNVGLTLGHLNLFVGTNASGKSNLFDALRVLQGIGYGFTIDEILNGKPKGANSEVWEGIRGGSEKAAFIKKSGQQTAFKPQVIEFSLKLAIERQIVESHLEAQLVGSGLIPFRLDIPTEPSDDRLVSYSIGFSARNGWVRHERLLIGHRKVFSSVDADNSSEGPVITVRYYSDGKGRPTQWKFEKSRPVLHQLLRHSICKESHRAVIKCCIGALSNMQRVDPSPCILREYSQTQTVRRMGERGENFAALINAIQSDEKTKSAYVSWLKQLTPAELDDVTVLKGALGEPLFAIKEAGIDYPAPILSDGTLRFAAITAAFFQTDTPDLITIEEIENGIHPSRLRLLVEMLRSQASLNRQVMATTHSPVVLAWLKPEDYASTFLCTRDEETGASKIVPLSEVPNLDSLVKKQSIGDLFTEGWLEEAL